MYLCFLFEIESLQPYPSRLMCRGLISVTYFGHALRVVVSQFCYLGWSCNSPLSSTGILLSFLMVGELQLDQISFDPLPSLPRNPLVEVRSREFPWTLNEQSSVSIVCNLHSVIHTAPHLKVLYSQTEICMQACRSTCASRMLVDSVSVNNPKFRYLQGS